MNARKHIRNFLLALVIGAVLYVAASEYVGRRQAVSEPRTAPAAADPDLIVYYFSQGKECPTCNNIEAYARETLDRHFAPELASGRIAWRSIDVDEPRHEHFVTDYNLYTKSVVLVRMKDGRQVRWTNLEDVWDLVYDKPAFVEYVRRHVQEYLDAAP